ncbi:hypothetical protein OMP38_13165 [Cohnella ginsengisoli]|uniref:Uncharacterized protein n=1 Tax=Cohnella ginsengisoli TaxID=425004 RepID=A0A9X4KGF7_9BACL|nr:hypothetical protein [Cohnella ginsengisoli]MDG0791712.1 hypothetical protein [Cohnella ginsengisoli]
MRFAQEGASVIINDLDRAKGQETVDEINKNGGQRHVHPRRRHVPPMTWNVWRRPPFKRSDASTCSSTMPASAASGRCTSWSSSNGTK